MSLGVVLVLATTFVVAAVGKLLDRRSFERVLAGLAGPLPARALAIVIPAGELALAAALLAGVQPRAVALLALAVLAAFSWALVRLRARPEIPSCKCFGARAGESADGVARNAALVALAAALAIAPLDGAAWSHPLEELVGAATLALGGACAWQLATVLTPLRRVAPAMSTTWIVSLAFAWVVIALLTGCVVTLMRQVGELRVRVDGAGGQPAAAPAAGPRLYDEVEAVSLPVLGAPDTRIAVGGEQERPALLVFHAPGCAGCADIEAALGVVAMQRPDVTFVSVVALERAAAAQHASTRRERRLAPVAVQDVPSELVPDGLPALVAVAREGVVAAIGQPDDIAHLREAADVADGAVLIAGPDSMRETDWGRAVPAWGVGPTGLDVLRVDGRGE